MCKCACDVAKCHAECCGPVPIANSIIKANASLIQRHVVNRMAIPAGFSPLLTEDSTIMTDADMCCAFLSLEHRCLIYDQRPQICRIFGAGGSPRLECPYLENRKKQVKQ